MEFIGPRGIGKTTLNNRLLKHFRKQWYFRDDLTKIRPAATHNPTYERLLWLIFSHRLENLEKTNISDFTKIQSVNQAIKAIYESLTINSHEFSKGFILDEGLFKKFYLEILNIDFSDTAILWHNRAFIYVRPDNLDTIWTRYSKRDRHIRQKNQNHKSLSKKEIFERANQEIVLLDQLYERALSENIKSLKINPEDGLEKNILDIIEFESKLTSSKQMC